VPAAQSRQIALLAGTPWLQQSIQERNPSVDPLNLIQIELIRRMVRFAWVALVAAAAGFTASLFGAGAVGAVALFVGLAAYVVIIYTGDRMWVGARPSGRDDVVILTRIHPAFAAALARQGDPAP